MEENPEMSEDSKKNAASLASYSFFSDLRNLYPSKTKPLLDLVSSVPDPNISQWQARGERKMRRAK
jgi:hypothetical protein